MALSAGAAACGIAAVEPVDDRARDIYDRWVTSGFCASMEFCRRYADIRDNPAMLLDGARTMICCAFNYHSGVTSCLLPGKVASYALAYDYHIVVKQRLQQLADMITSTYGGETRVCVDTAPLRERYWAARCGVGFIGINNQLIVPGVGSYVFLGEVLWTGQASPTPPLPKQTCDNCMACVSACPGHALASDGSCDARQCISYLTIEHRGEFPPDLRLDGWIYGCDACQRVCPHNREIAVTSIPEFNLTHPIALLSADDLATFSSSRFRKLSATSAMSRITLAQLLRNIGASNQDQPLGC